MTSRYEEELFEQTGQYEPLTTRIRNILREYKEGEGIFKELIQNADDAGAGTVKFLVDWRRGRTGSLFSPGMAACQGPALWAYNDSVFSDEDFENINKLAGETKVEDVSKIGRFGLGFNAVYHVTDVPSFISRKHLVVFDPNIHHLGRHIKDRSRPGIHINLAKKPESLTRYHDQFQLYNGVFGCNAMQTRGHFNYKGTLFRFPFRTASQARSSDISKNVYDRDRVGAIVSSLCECASTLLLFSQHVKKVEVYELDESSRPDEMRLVLSVNKPSVRAFGQEGFDDLEPFIKQCSKWWSKYRAGKKSCTEYPSGCELVNVVTTRERSELSRCERRHSSDLTWCVVSASGTDSSLQIARSSEGRVRGFLPCGGVAFVVRGVSRKGSRKSNISANLLGELFCFFPLSIPTGLPVHVNGYFAIMSNRAEIWKRTNMRIQPIEVEWNEALMEDALARAYIMLLEKMKESIHNLEDYQFHTLWPSCDAVDMQSWEKLVRKVCTILLDNQSELFYSDGRWMNVNDGFLLSDDFNEIYETAVEVSRALEIHVFKLPRNILKTLMKFDQEDILQRRTLSFSMFMKQYFFPKIHTLTSTHRDAIVCFALDRIWRGTQSRLPSSIEESELVKRNPCISVSRDGRHLAKPNELIHPHSPAAKLFCEIDQRFPVGKDLCTDIRLQVLEKLGMVKDLDWQGIYERARSITNSASPQVERSRKLIEYLNKRVNDLPKSADYRNRLQHVKFLPVLKEPVDGFLLPWKESRWPLSRFCSPQELFLPSDAKLIGSSCYILDTSPGSGCGKLNYKVKNLLGFDNRLPEHRLVVKQLDEAIKFWRELSETERQDRRTRDAIQSVCEKIYGFFSERIAEKAKNQTSLDQLDKRDWLFLQGKFVNSKKVAYTSNGNGAPFLFTLTPDYKRDFRHLFEAMQIKHTFDVEDYINALNELKNFRNGCALTRNELQITLFFVAQIDVRNPAVKNHIGKIPLPDTDGILRQSKDIVVNLEGWLKDRDNNVKVHEKISPQTARALGAKSLKSVVLKNHSHRIDYGESFGQREELTDRLRGILDGYPDDGILKELVQNADDARASEIHFIYDTRTLGSKSVATDEASEEIQGPALCVYNDKPFTEKDLEGIKKLGIGSKRDSLGMTGKYGIGFNSVYHLTDCPSFLSNNDTLAFLDPHGCYFADDDRGRLFKLQSMDKEFRRNISDTLRGYLSDHFDLKNSTMFRFPLRPKRNESKISSLSPDMEKLLSTFQKEARKSLLFLNHVKKITLSKIHPNNKLEKIYRVEILITAENEKKRREMQQKSREFNDTPTEEIKWQGANYTVALEENKKIVEEWLIQKCIGSDIDMPTFGTSDGERCEIPDGRKLGLLPRGGLAARLWTASCRSEAQETFRGIVYCFLPLPENYTSLPVHVNGHFALDSTRRRLWTDTDGEGGRSRWNHFMNSRVLPPAYAALIIEARNHLCNDDDDQFSRYHSLFPDVLSGSPWETLTTELYYYLGRTKAKVMPLLVPTSENGRTGYVQSRAGRSKTVDSSRALSPVPITFSRWLSAHQAYFVTISGLEASFLHLLIRIGVPVLLHAPCQIHNGFRSAGVVFHEVNPISIIEFLREFESRKSTCKIRNLPEVLQGTAVESVLELSELIQYCREDEDFGEQLGGLPLLLTQDGYLRVFKPHEPVFHSKFGDLFPSHTHLFLHRRVVKDIPRTAIKSEEKIVLKLTVRDVAKLLPDVFTNKMLRAIANHSTWKFPAEGTLSKQWFEIFWDFLQNHASSKPKKALVSLECLSEWPVIPTTRGKLVRIKDAKSVLDMTRTGTESTAQENVRTFLTDLECPVLDRDITFDDESSFTATMAVTDPYVAHPYNVRDVLVVLECMMNANNLQLSKVYEKDIRDFLRFVQDERSEDVDQCQRIIKSLPFHKTLSGQFVSLTDHSTSYALIPFSVPIQQLDELQKRAKCIFLNSNALPTLANLYKDLGVKAGQNVPQFYMEYVFKHFNLFTRENQIQHLIYIRDKVHPSLGRGDPEKRLQFLKCMAETPCIPDANGHLHLPCDFFDPSNDVFKAMYEGDNNEFPPPPFNEGDWSDLLQDIGLQVDITPQLFLKFCTTVAEGGRLFPSSMYYREKSKALVKCLFSEESSLRGERFLSQVSEIKFVAPEEVEEELTSIHKQYHCRENGFPPFTNFKNAVPWCYRSLSWTTAPILPRWAPMAEIKSHGITCSGPSYTKVLDHLKNVVSSNNLNSIDIDRLHEIMKSIYQFLLKATKCCGRTPNDECSDVCLDIGARLKSFPCIFLQENETFVTAEQLVFQLSDTCPLKPFLFSVPREFGELEHFLKRLGATEKPTVLQIACVLDSVHEQIKHEVLSHEFEKKVKYAMRVFFGLLARGESADEVDELYLPTQDKRMIRSCEMICKVSSRYADSIGKRAVLMRFEECGLKKVADDYIDALPEHLRPTKFDEKVREEVDHKCRRSICAKARHGSTCSFQKQFQNLLQSDEFQNGLKRLLVEDGKDPQEFERIMRTLQMHVTTNCIGSQKVTIRVIDRDTDKVMDKLEESCFAVREEDAWSLYMQHKFKDDKGLASTVTSVNRILGNCIRKENGLSAMLGCSSPSEIERKLNTLNITQSTCRTADDCDDLEDDILLECERSDGSVGREFDGETGGFAGILGTIRGMRDGARNYDGGYGVGYRIRAGGGGGHSRMKNEVEDERFYPKSSEEATRWLEQSKSDLASARWLLRSGPPFSAHACFQSQQVVEKCLKGMLFYSCGISGQLLGSHDVLELACKVREETCELDEEDLETVRKVARYYLPTRYPNRQPFNVVPANAFDKNEAETAVEAASKVLNLVDEYCL